MRTNAWKTNASQKYKKKEIVIEIFYSLALQRSNFWIIGRPLLFANTNVAIFHIAIILRLDVE